MEEAMGRVYNRRRAITAISARFHLPLSLSLSRSFGRPSAINPDVYIIVTVLLFAWRRFESLRDSFVETSFSPRGSTLVREKARGTSLTFSVYSAIKRRSGKKFVRSGTFMQVDLLRALENLVSSIQSRWLLSCRFTVEAPEDCECHLRSNM